MSEIKSKIYELGYKVKSKIQSVMKSNPAAERIEVQKQYYEQMKEAMMKKWQGR